MKDEEEIIYRFLPINHFFSHKIFRSLLITERLLLLKIVFDVNELGIHRRGKKEKKIEGKQTKILKQYVRFTEIFQFGNKTPLGDEICTNFAILSQVFFLSPASVPRLFWIIPQTRFSF